MLRDELAQAAEEERKAEAGLEDARRRLRAVILKASDEGLSKALIARLTGRSRQTIHRDLERAEKEARG
jgi:DNA-directed RNA polymerase specialized sigma24 family protein